MPIAHKYTNRLGGLAGAASGDTTAPRSESDIHSPPKHSKCTSAAELTATVEQRRERTIAARLFAFSLNNQHLYDVSACLA
jgi:hypothetical protein